MMTSDLTHARLCELLSYDAETGAWTWLVGGRGGTKAGAVAGCLDGQGYVIIGIDGRLYRAHRLAVFYMTGAWPKGDTDHWNLRKADNRWVNLREATRAQNVANTPLRRDNKLGIKGVYRLPSGKYRVTIMYQGKNRHLGYYATQELAAWMYGAAAEAVFGEFARVA
jgi:HNH endonuclease